MVKIGLIGAGFMGSTHLACYEKLMNIKDFKVTAIADLDFDKASKYAEKFGAVAYKTGEELIEKADVNTVDICLPTYLHAHHGILAMEKGYNVFIEKPVCLNEDEAQKLLEVQQRKGVKAMVGQCLRMWPEYMYLKNLVDSGEYGAVKSAVFKRLSPKPLWGWNNWLHDKEKSGGAVMDLHIHDVDFARYILGEPEEIKASILYNSGNPEHVFSIYRYSNATAFLEGGWDFPQNFTFEMEYRVTFENAVVVFNSTHNPTVKIYPNSGDVIIPNINTDFNEENKESIGNISSLGGYYNELAYFIDCLLSEKPIEVSPLIEGIQSLRLLLREIETA